MYFDFQPVRRGGTCIAIAAGVPLGRFAEVAADVALAALGGLHEALHFMVALPGAFSFRGVFDLADKKRVQAGVLFLPEEEAIGGEGIAAGAASFLVILL